MQNIHCERINVIAAMQYAIEDIDSERFLVIPNIPMNFMALVFNNSLAGSLITLLRPRLSA